MMEYVKLGAEDILALAREVCIHPDSTTVIVAAGAKLPEIEGKLKEEIDAAAIGGWFQEGDRKGSNRYLSQSTDKGSPPSELEIRDAIELLYRANYFGRVVLREECGV